MGIIEFISGMFLIGVPALFLAESLESSEPATKD